MGACVKKTSLKQEIHELLAQGVSPADVFERFRGAKAKEATVANIIAAYPDPALLKQYKAKRELVIAMAVVQALLALGLGLVLEPGMVPLVQIGLTLLSTFIPALLLWGFIRNMMGAYNAYILVAFSQLPRLLMDAGSSPLFTLAALVVNVGLIVYVRNVREHLFPYAGLLGAKKRDGVYVFLMGRAPAPRPDAA